MRLLTVGAALAVVLSACANGGSSGVAERREVVAGVDLSRHSVPLEDIHFNTFDGRSITLSEASELTIERLRDAIPPIDEPVYEDVEGGAWLDGDDAVLGFVGEDGAPRAFPHKILNFHEIVNDTFAGVPVLVSYCPLCNSGVVFDRRVDGETLTFGNTSALFENDLVMEDRETRSYWWQVRGEAIVGELTGSRLEPLPSSTMRWSAWRELHPDTLVLSRDLGFDRPYEHDPFTTYAERVNRGETPFPVSDEALGDGRLDPASQVIGVDRFGEAKAYPIALLGQMAVNDTVAGEPVVVFVDAESGGAAAFDPVVRGTQLTFVATGDGRFEDEQTGSTWDLAGRATAGDLEGEQLQRVSSRSTFWFAYVAAFPNVDVYFPSGRP